jgi:hypothetical protein
MKFVHYCFAGLMFTNRSPWPCGLKPFAVIAVSSPAEGMDVRLFCWLRVVCDELITRLEKFYWMFASHYV